MEYPVGRWQKCNFANVSDTGYLVDSLTEDTQYQFRVCAKNAAGSISIPAMTTDPVTAKNEHAAPKIDMDARFAELVTMRAGDTLKLEAGIRGKPEPAVTWMRENERLSQNADLALKSVSGCSSLTIPAVQRSNGGCYEIIARNVAGTQWVRLLQSVFRIHIKFLLRSLRVNVKVLDRPSAPAGPIAISNLSCDGCTIAWNPPVDDGGDEIINYIVEKRETCHLAWVLVSASLKDTSYDMSMYFERVFRQFPFHSSWVVCVVWEVSRDWHWRP